MRTRGFLIGLGGVLLVAVPFAILTLGMRLVGQTQPPPEILTDLHLNECALPCWLGIVPGQTAFVDAVQRVREAYAENVYTDNASVLLVPFSEASDVEIFIGAAQGAVRTIQLRLDVGGGLTLGDVINWLGMPTCPISFTWETAHYVLSGAHVAIIPLGSERWLWKQPIREIRVDALARDYVCPAQER